MKLLARVAVALGAISPLHGARAALLTLDFNDAESGFLTTSYIEDGFRITPNCHVDILDFGQSPGDNWLGWDHSFGCQDPEPASVRLERGDGGLFHLLSMGVTDHAWFEANSSAGGSQVLRHDCDDVFYQPFLCPEAFHGPEWRHLTYVDFTLISDFGDPQGFDNVQLVSVSEPTSLALISMGLLLLVAVAERRKLEKPAPS